MKDANSHRSPTPLPRQPKYRQAVDPFFIFTYTLVALAAVIQIFLMFWMDFL